MKRAPKGVFFTLKNSHYFTYLIDISNTHGDYDNRCKELILTGNKPKYSIPLYIQKIE